MDFRKHILQTAFATLALLLLSGSAFAQRSPRSVEPMPAAAAQDTVTKHYGMQILVVDAAVVASALAIESGEIFVGGYLLSGPIVHVANGNGGKVIGSLLLRTGLPIGGAMLGAAAANCDGSEDEFLCGVGEAAIGLLAGMVAATVIDATVLAKKTSVEERLPALLRYGGVAANPDVAVTRNGSFTVGLSGSF